MEKPPISLKKKVSTNILIDKKIKISSYLLVPLVLIIVLAVLGIISEIITENLPSYNPVDDSGLKGLAITLIYLPIFYIGAIIINAPIMWFVIKNINNLKNILIKIVLSGSVIISIIIAVLISNLSQSFFTIYLGFQFLLILVGFIWALISWTVLNES